MTDPVEQKEWAEGLLRALDEPWHDDERVHPGWMALCNSAPDLAAAVISLAGEVERLTEAVRLLRQNHSDLLRALDVHGGGSLCETCSFLAALSPLPSERKDS